MYSNNILHNKRMCLPNSVDPTGLNPAKSSKIRIHLLLNRRLSRLCQLQSLDLVRCILGGAFVD